MLKVCTVKVIEGRVVLKTCLPRCQGAMVSNSALAAVCVWSGLQEYLLFESNQLSNSIQTYANELKERQEKEYALAAEEGRSPGQYWLDTEPPKVSLISHSISIDAKPPDCRRYLMWLSPSLGQSISRIISLPLEPNHYSTMCSNPSTISTSHCRHLLTILQRFCLNCSRPKAVSSSKSQRRKTRMKTQPIRMVRICGDISPYPD